MHASIDEFHLNLPCPACDYDLRGQTDPRCPECGRTFASIDELRALALDVKRVFNRVLVWRLKFAFAYLLAFGWLGAGSLIVGNTASSPSPIGIIGLLVVILPFIVMPAMALVFLIQVLRLRFDSNIGRAQRRELNGTIPLLLVYMSPGVFFAPWALHVAIAGKSAFGTGV